MSSFTISKKEYMKAAGLVSGLAEATNAWIYDYETGRNSTPEDYKRRFEECYTMNALSVLEQYHGDEVGAPSSDSNSYTTDFNAYQAKGKQFVFKNKTLAAIHELQGFFTSAIYQTENMAYMFKMQMFFDHIIAALLKKTQGDFESWGELKIDNI